MEHTGIKENKWWPWWISDTCLLDLRKVEAVRKRADTHIAFDYSGGLTRKQEFSDKDMRDATFNRLTKRLIDGK